MDYETPGHGRYIVTTLSRSDIRDALGAKVAAELSRPDIIELAIRLGEWYLENHYWDKLREFVSGMLAERGIDIGSLS